MKSLKTLSICLMILTASSCANSYTTARLPVPPKTEYPRISQEEFFACDDYVLVLESMIMHVSNQPGIMECAGYVVSQDTLNKFHQIIMLQSNRIITLENIIKKNNEHVE